MKGEKMAVEFKLSDTPALKPSMLMKSYNLGANPEDYRFYEIHIQVTVVDMGPFAGTEFVKPKDEGGWEPTRKLSGAFQANGVVGFQYPSSPAVQQGKSGTCFCIYQFAKAFAEDDFREVSWTP
jgi:hypothetical protein